VGWSPASETAVRIARICPTPDGSGPVMWWASEVMPKPASRPRTRAPRPAAKSARSRIMMPAPSPSTKPSRSTSNGREARSGSSFRFDKVRAWANPAIVSGVIAASAPPASTTSASPDRISRTAIASASAPEAQAETGV
jgi:hypothetical protein